MSSTNKTLTIELSQYVGTDKPTYLSDYNGDMLKIDNAIAADRDSIATAQSKADGADAKADTNAGAISTLDGQINNASNGLTKRVTDVEGDVNTIESLIGNGTPTTTDKTIIGAINELDTIKLDITDLTASNVPISAISGMSATDVQAALAELAATAPTSGYNVAGAQTGAVAIEVPATAREFLVMVKPTQSSRYVIPVLYDMGSGIFGTGCYGSSNVGIKIQVTYDRENNTFTLRDSIVDGTDQTATGHTTVFYR